MPKIKRPSLKEKLWVQFSDGLLNFAESLPPIKKGFLAWLQNVREDIILTENAKPSDVKLDLLCLWICEIIPIEQFERQIPSIVRMFTEHKSTRFLLRSERPQDMLAELRSFKETVLGTSWHNFRVLDCESFSEKLDVDYISIEMEVFSGGHVAVYIRIVPNQKFLNKLATIIQSEYRPYSILSPPRNLRSLLHFWGWRTSPAETKKRDDLQNTIVELKDSVRSHLQRYFSGLLFKPGHMLPSIELWTKVESDSQEAIDARKPPFKTFWDSVGFPNRGTERYVDSSGQYTLMLPERNIPDYVIKILCDQSKLKKESDFGDSLSSQISHTVNDWIPTLISIWSLRSICMDYIDEASADRLTLFSKMRKLSALQTFRWTKIFFAREAQFKRLQKDLSLSDYRRDFGFNIPDFKQTIFKPARVLSDNLIGNTNYLQKKLTDLLNSTQQFLKTTAEAHIVSTNHFTQLTNVALGLIMLFLSGLMVIVGVLEISAKPKVCETPRFAPVCSWAISVLDQNQK